eukprot:UN10315
MTTVFAFVAVIVFIFLNNDCVEGYDCIVIEDDIPSPFTDNHCIQKVEKLLLKDREFILEIASPNEQLLR